MSRAANASRAGCAVTMSSETDPPVRRRKSSLGLSRTSSTREPNCYAGISRHFVFICAPLRAVPLRLTMGEMGIIVRPESGVAGSEVGQCPTRKLSTQGERSAAESCVAVPSSSGKTKKWALSCAFRNDSSSWGGPTACRNYHPACFLFILRARVRLLPLDVRAGQKLHVVGFAHIAPMPFRHEVIVR